jgi:hypothetical protein
MMRPQADLVITIVWGVIVATVMILMGMEVIHNQQVVDRLLVTMPTVSALVVAYWFNKKRGE